MTTPTIILLIIFVAALCLSLAIMEMAVTRSKWKKLNERIKPMYQTETVETNTLLSRLKRRVNRSEYAKELDHGLKGADMKLTPFDWLAIQLGVFAGLAVILHVIVRLEFPFELLASWLLTGVGAKQFLKSRRSKLSQELSKQLPELCRMVSSCVRAGLSLQQGFEMVAKELRAPAGPIFRNMSSELKMGTSMESVLERLTERVKSKDISIFVQMINVQRKAGGNISQAMDQLAKTLDDRARINGEIRTQTAETKFVAVALILMPVIMVLMFNMMFDGFLMPLFTLPGIVLLVVVALVMSIGFYLIQKVSNVKV